MAKDLLKVISNNKQTVNRVFESKDSYPLKEANREFWNAIMFDIPEDFIDHAILYKVHGKKEIAYIDLIDGKWEWIEF